MPDDAAAANARIPIYCHGSVTQCSVTFPRGSKILEHGRAGFEQMDRMLADATSMPEAVFADAELKTIQTGMPFPDKLVRKVL
jgi:hypothetical protein